MPGPLHIGQIKGTNLAIHYSSLIGFGLIAWFLADSVYPTFYPGWSSTKYWFTSTASVMLLFISVLIHELAHSFAAKARGRQVVQITLFIFGGITYLNDRKIQLHDEMFITVAGPFTSLCIAIPLVFTLAFLNESAENSSIGAILAFTGIANGFIVIVNLIPGLPLDGGQIVRSLISHSTNSRIGANNIAVRIGQIAGWLFVGFGLFQLFHSSYINGLWLTFFGWFLLLAATHEWKSKNTENDLGPISVSQLMYRSPKTASPHLSIQDVLGEFFVGSSGTSVAVVENHSFQGVVHLADIIRTPSTEWGTTSVKSIMKHSSPITIHPDESTLSAMNLLAINESNDLYVVQDGNLVGMLQSQDILRYLDFKEQLRKT
ncbi:site-2 protease family protein [Dehalococcoidia bacterium]|nr:site-2 protease family protein [Dehalococcoidia bacterium]